MSERIDFGGAPRWAMAEGSHKCGNCRRDHDEHVNDESVYPLCPAPETPGPAIAESETDAEFEAYYNAENPQYAGMAASTQEAQRWMANLHRDAHLKTWNASRASSQARAGKEFEEAVWLAKAYSLSYREHTKPCLPNVFYPGLGNQDDRCSICKRMDEFMNNQAWKVVEERKRSERS